MNVIYVSTPTPFPFRHFSRTSPRVASQGFTLLELLVVVAIIGLLSAILFPVFSRVRENARRTTCESNLKQIGLAMVQYTQDFDETLPGGDPSSTFLCKEEPNGISVNCLQLLNPYIKNTQVWACPSNSYSSMEMDWGNTFYSNPDPRASYSGNYQIFARRFGAPHPISFILQPSEKLLITDTVTFANGSGVNGASDSCLGYDNWNSTNGFPVNGFAGHMGTMNVLFCDGHVKAERPQQTAGAGGATNMWGRFGDSPTDSSCPSGVALANDLNCNGFSAGATSELNALEAEYQ